MASRNGKKAKTRMTLEERQMKRREKREKERNGTVIDPSPSQSVSVETHADQRIAELLARNEDDLLKFVANINRVYQEKLGKSAPFMTFVFCGMQSAGKSTIMERFMMAVLNIVQEGTGTRCPLDTTCIHDDSCHEPRCDLYGSELAQPGKDLSVSEVFKRITKHNKDLGEQDKFSTASISLTFRSAHVQNMRFVDTPGIISNKSTGNDNREDIKSILRHEMQKTNARLCVLLEPKEFATNPIVDFCDESLGGRDKWVDDAVFLMNKFDKHSLRIPVLRVKRISSSRSFI